jgi:hypothetical protein
MFEQNEVAEPVLAICCPLVGLMGSVASAKEK